MNWIQEAAYNPATACVAKLCWANNSSDPCGIKVCATKFCFSNYSN